MHFMQKLIKSELDISGLVHHFIHWYNNHGGVDEVSDYMMVQLKII
jgi:hypothetical protein